MPILIPGKLCFLAHPRTGSHAVAEALLTLEGAQKVEGHHVSPGWAAASGVQEPLLYTLRDPAEIMQAWYVRQSWYSRQYRDRPIPDFAQFCREFDNGNLTMGSGRLLWHDGEGTGLYYPKLQEALNIFLKSLRLPEVQLERINVTQPVEGRGKPEITSEVRQVLEERFPADCAAWRRLSFPPV